MNAIPLRQTLCQSLAGMLFCLGMPAAFGQNPPATPAPSTTTGIKDLNTLRNQATGVWSDNGPMRIGPATNEVLSGKLPMGVWSDRMGFGQGTSSVFADAASRKAAESAFLQDLARCEQRNKQFRFVTIAKLMFRDASFDSALEVLRQQAQKSAGSGTTINTVILSPADQFPRVTLDLTNIPFLEAVRYLCDQAGADFDVEPFAIAIRRQQSNPPPFRIPARFPAKQPLLSVIVIPEMALKQASLAEALAALKEQAATLTNGAVSINWVVGPPAAPEPPSITLHLRSVPFVEVLRYICELSHTDFSVEQHGIVIQPGLPTTPGNREK